jgi:hypothetical protein
MIYLHIHNIYIQIQGLLQARLSTADYALSRVVQVTTEVWSLEAVIRLATAKFKLLIFLVSGFTVSSIANKLDKAKPDTEKELRLNFF